MKIISKTKLAFDTNIWIYLLDKKSPFHKLALEAFTIADKYDCQIILTHQNILEIIKVLIKWYGYKPAQALKQSQKIISTDVFIVQPSVKTLTIFFKIAVYSMKKSNNFDLYLAATLIDNGVKILITNDKSGFQGLKGMEIIPLKEFASWQETLEIMADKRLSQEIKKGLQEIKSSEGVSEVKPRKH